MCEGGRNTGESGDEEQGAHHEHGVSNPFKKFHRAHSSAKLLETCFAISFWQNMCYPQSVVQRRATVKDVARECGVSITTVSHHLSGRKNACSPETAERISKAVEKLRYVPNVVGASLRRSRTNMIGVCIYHPFADPSLAPDDDLWRNGFSERVWRGIVQESQGTDYRLVLYPHVERVGSATQPFVDGSIDGLLFMGTAGDPRPAQTAAAGVPVVAISRDTNLRDGVSVVSANERTIVDLALDHLWSLGRRRIGHITGPVLDYVEPTGYRIHSDPVARARLDAVRDWGLRMSYDTDRWMAKADGWESESGVDEAVRWFAEAEHPDAVFCANDTKALRLTRLLRQAGIDVPGQVAVVGVDDVLAARSAEIPLTTIDVSGEVIGRAAFRRLLLQIHSPDTEATSQRIDCSRLVVRSSTAVSSH